MSMLPEKSSPLSQISTTASARIVALRHCDLSPSLKLIAARLSITVAGQSELPVTPRPRPSAAAPSAHIVIPNLEMQYAVLPANAPTAVVIGGLIVTTRPKPPRSMCGRHACVIANEPRALIDVIRSYFFIGVSTMSCHHSADALFTQMSTRPHLATAASTQRPTAASSRRSTWNGSDCTPSASTSAATV